MFSVLLNERVSFVKRSGLCWWRKVDAKKKNQPLYTMRSLETHDVNFTSFYVTRTVQSLCHDAKNYVESFIFDTTEELRLFAYQIIWNMLASSYKDDDSTELDDLKLKMELTAYGETWQGTTEVETWKWHFAISKVGDDCRHMRWQFNRFPYLKPFDMVLV